MANGIRPIYIQNFINTNAELNKKVDLGKLVDSYYVFINLRRTPDTNENFNLFALAYLDGHANGYGVGIQEAAGK